MPWTISRRRRTPSLARCLAAALWLGACASPPPRIPPVAAAGLAAIDLGPISLLPAAAFGTMRLPTAPAPAFDRGDEPALDATQSWSIGTASRGYLVNGQALEPPGPYIAIRPISFDRRAIWSTEPLNSALIRAGRAVNDRTPGSVLWVGDLSAEKGGDIAHHQSHNSGRDADIAFYLRDASGRLAEQPDFIHLDRHGMGQVDQNPVAFDAGRNWTLVETLLRDPHIQVQWIFVSAPLRQALLDQAARVDAEAIIVERASAVLKQPGDSAAHRDHFHIRIHCGRLERAEGCLDNGPQRAWIHVHDDAVSQRLTEVFPLLKAGGPGEIRYAITRIVRLRARTALPHIEPLRAHPDPEVAALATEAAAFLRGEFIPPRWSHLVDDDAGE